jgi:hypothetical protein
MGRQPGSSTLVELRNEKPIVQAAIYVQAELEANLELTALNQSGTLVLGCVLDLVKQVGFGQDKHILLESCDKFIESLSFLTPQQKQLARVLPEPEPMGEPVEHDAVEAEIVRRTKERERVGNIQEDLQNQRDDLRRELGSHTELVRHGLANAKVKARKRSLEKEIKTITTTIDAITEALCENDRDVQKLVIYREACRLAKRGLPSGIIGRSFAIKK